MWRIQRKESCHRFFLDFLDRRKFLGAYIVQCLVRAERICNRKIKEGPNTEITWRVKKIKESHEMWRYKL